MGKAVQGKTRQDNDDDDDSARKHEGNSKQSKVTMCYTLHNEPLDGRRNIWKYLLPHSRQLLLLLFNLFE